MDERTSILLEMGKTSSNRNREASFRNLDLRDSHEYIQKQVWGGQPLQGRVAGGLIW